MSSLTIRHVLDDGSTLQWSGIPLEFGVDYTVANRNLKFSGEMNHPSWQAFYPETIAIGPSMSPLISGGVGYFGHSDPTGITAPRIAIPTDSQ